MPPCGELIFESFDSLRGSKLSINFVVPKLDKAGAARYIYQYMSNYSDIELKPSPDQTAACEVTLIHEDQVRAALAVMIDSPTASGVADIFQALGDPTRLKLISALTAAELCVCDLAATLGMTQSAVSHQLRLLRALGVVKNRKEGRVVYYSLDDDHIHDLFRRGVEHYQHGILK